MTKSRLPTRKEVVLLLLPFIVVALYSAYLAYVQKVNATLKGKWVVIDQSGSVAPGEKCFVSFDGQGTSRMECKGVVLDGLATDCKTQSNDKIRWGRIDFYDGKILSNGWGWPYSVYDHKAYFKIENENLISVRWSSLVQVVGSPPIEANADPTASDFAKTESFCQWKRIK